MPSQTLTFSRIAQARTFLQTAGYRFTKFGGNYDGTGGNDPRKECYEANGKFAILRPIPFRGYRLAIFTD